MKKTTAEKDFISCNQREKQLKEWDSDDVSPREGNTVLKPAQSNAFRLAIPDWNMTGIDIIELL